MRRHAPAAIFFLFASIVMTWPLARVLRFAVADPSDPYLNTWVLDWDYYATFVSPRPLFEADIFYPAHDTLAFTENLFGLAMIAAPLRMVGVAPLTAHNVLLLLGFAASGFAMYLLAALMTGSRSAGVIAGIAYAFVPWRFTHLTHVQYAWTAALPLLLLATLRKKPIAFALAVIFAGTTNLHVLAFGGLAAATAILLQRDIRWMARACLAAIVALIILSPLLLPYRRVMREQHFRGDRAETMHYSALPGDWLVSNFHNRFYLPLGTNDGKSDPERWLFPGLGIVLLAASALMRRDVRTQPALRIAVAWIVLGFLGSLGLHFPLHAFLFDSGLLKGIRVPARWSMVTHAGLGLAAAYGAARFRTRTALLMAAALLVELHAAPLRWFMTSGRSAEVDRWLATSRANAVLNLPAIEGNSEYTYVLGATMHHRPIVNGVAGNATPELLAFASNLTGGLVPELRRRGVDLVIVRGDLLGGKAAAVREFLGRTDMRFVRQIDNDYIFSTTDRHPAADADPVRRFVRGDPPNRSDPFGSLDLPATEQRVRGTLEVAGWAVAQAGVREVIVLLNAGGSRVRARRCTRPDVLSTYVNYAPTSITGFCARIERPWWLPELTDVQVEIVDNNGTRVRLPDRWFTWAR